MRLGAVAGGEAICTPPNAPHFGRNATDKESKTTVIRVKAGLHSSKTIWKTG